MPETIDSMTSVRQEIRHFIVENFLFGQDQGLDDGASLLENGIIDSTGVLELVAHLEGIYRRQGEGRRTDSRQFRFHRRYRGLPCPQGNHIRPGRIDPLEQAE